MRERPARRASASGTWPAAINGWRRRAEARAAQLAPAHATQVRRRIERHGAQAQRARRVRSARDRIRWCASCSSIVPDGDARMSRFDSIVVGDDLVSEHWLTEQYPSQSFKARVAPAWKEWDDRRRDHRRARAPCSLGTHLVDAARADSASRATPTSCRERHASVAGRPRVLRRRDGLTGRARRPSSRSRPSRCRARPARTLLVVQPRCAHASRTCSTRRRDAGHLLDAGGRRRGRAHGSPRRRVSAAVRRRRAARARRWCTAGRWLLLAERERWAGGPLPRRRPRCSSLRAPRRQARRRARRRSPRWSPPTVARPGRRRHHLVARRCSTSRSSTPSASPRTCARASALSIEIIANEVVTPPAPTSGLPTATPTRPQPT